MNMKYCSDGYGLCLHVVKNERPCSGPQTTFASWKDEFRRLARDFHVNKDVTETIIKDAQVIPATNHIYYERAQRKFMKIVFKK